MRHTIWLASLLLVSTWTSGAAQLAIVPGDPTDIRLSALLEADLSTQKTLTLIDRQALHRVLAELKLTGLQKEHAPQVGRLLGAELFLFVDPVPASEPESVRLQVVEIATGLVLGDLVASVEALAEDRSPALQMLNIALATQATPLDKRLIISLLGVRSEALDASLDPVAEALGMLLMSDLNRRPEIIVVDRHRLDMLLQEEILADVRLATKASALTVEGAIKEHEAGYRLTLAVASPGQMPRHVSVNCPATIQKARLAAGRALTRLLAVKLEPTGNREHEAAMFLARSTCQLYDQSERRRAAATAYALQPTQENLLNLADQANLCPEDYKAQPIGLYACALYERYYRQEIKRLKPGQRYLQMETFLDGIAPLSRENWQPVADEIPLSVEEVLAERRYLQLKLRYGLLKDRPWPRFYIVLMEIVRRAGAWSLHADEWARYVQAVLPWVERPPAPYKRLYLHHGFVQHLAKPTKHIRHDEQRLRAALNKLPEHPLNAVLADVIVATYGGDTYTSASEAAQHALAHFEAEEDYFARQAHSVVRAVARQWIHNCLERASPLRNKEGDWEATARQVVQFLKPALEQRDGEALIQWLTVKGNWTHTSRGTSVSSRNLVLESIGHLPHQVAKSLLEQIEEVLQAGLDSPTRGSEAYAIRQDAARSEAEAEGVPNRSCAPAIRLGCVSVKAVAGTTS